MDIDDGEECVFTEEDNEMFEAFEREMAQQMANEDALVERQEQIMSRMQVAEKQQEKALLLQQVVQQLRKAITRLDLTFGSGMTVCACVVAPHYSNLPQFLQHCKYSFAMGQTELQYSQNNTITLPPDTVGMLQCQLFYSDPVFDGVSTGQVDTLLCQAERQIGLWENYALSESVENPEDSSHSQQQAQEPAPDGEATCHVEYQNYTRTVGESVRLRIRLSSPADIRFYAYCRFSTSSAWRFWPSMAAVQATHDEGDPLVYNVVVTHSRCDIGKLVLLSIRAANLPGTTIPLTYEPVVEPQYNLFAQREFNVVLCGRKNKRMCIVVDRSLSYTPFDGQVLRIGSFVWKLNKQFIEAAGVRHGCHNILATYLHDVVVQQQLWHLVDERDIVARDRQDVAVVLHDGQPEVLVFRDASECTAFILASQQKYGLLFGNDTTDTDARRYINDCCTNGRDGRIRYLASELSQNTDHLGAGSHVFASQSLDIPVTKLFGAPSHTSADLVYILFVGAKNNRIVGAQVGLVENSRLTIAVQPRYIGCVIWAVQNQQCIMLLGPQDCVRTKAQPTNKMVLGGSTIVVKGTKVKVASPRTVTYTVGNFRISYPDENTAIFSNGVTTQHIDVSGMDESGYYTLAMLSGIC